jgi:hypothetical protein
VDAGERVVLDFDTDSVDDHQPANAWTVLEPDLCGQPSSEGVPEHRHVVEPIASSDATYVLARAFTDFRPVALGVLSNLGWVSKRTRLAVCSTISSANVVMVLGPPPPWRSKKA